ncbi:hypothetical protein ACFOHS_09395 [Jhaorihella thermophila]
MATVPNRRATDEDGMIFMRRVLTLLALLLWAGGAPAQNATAPDTAAGGARATTLEDILARQKNRLKGTTQRLPDALREIEGRPVPLPDGDAGVPQLGTLGGASDPDLWRALKSGAQATPSSSTARGQLMQVLGEDWRLVRRQYLLRYGGYVLLGMAAIIVLFRLIRGKIAIRGGRSGRTIPRFSLSHRIAHWFLASVFILMGLSGLIILFGRPLLVEFLGRDLLVGRMGMDPSVIDTLKSVNSVLLSASLQGHNLFGPVFVLAWAIMVVRFMKGNFFQWADAKWILKGGGLLGGHASSHHYNFGEKDLVLDGGADRAGHVRHGPVPAVPDAQPDAGLSPGGNPSARHRRGAADRGGDGTCLCRLDRHGRVDRFPCCAARWTKNWAKEHHDLWYEEVTGKKADHANDPGGAEAQAEGAA